MPGHHQRLVCAFAGVSAETGLPWTRLTEVEGHDGTGQCLLRQRLERGELRQLAARQRLAPRLARRARVLRIVLLVRVSLLGRRGRAGRRQQRDIHAMRTLGGYGKVVLQKDVELGGH